MPKRVRLKVARPRKKHLQPWRQNSSYWFGWALFALSLPFVWFSLRALHEGIVDAHYLLPGIGLFILGIAAHLRYRRG
jgi:hypothetical protein